MKTLTYMKSLYTFLEEVVKEFLSNRCPQRAAGLAYTTLLAIVPLFTVLLGFGGSLIRSETVQTFLAETLLPTSQETILSALSDFAENSSRFGTMGILIFVITIVMLLNNIEIHLSTVFRMRTERTLILRFTTYTAVLVFAGLFIGASITFSGNLFNSLLETYGNGQISTNLMRQVSSFLFIFLTLLLLITLMPSGKIRFTSALIGAASGSVLWEIAKRLFSAWVNQSVRISVIYGSLFLVPLILIWIYVVWITILLAVEITYVHQHREFCYFRDTAEKFPGGRIRDSLRLYSTISERFLKRNDPPQLHELSMHLNLPEMEVELLLDPFLDARLIHRVRLGARQDAYVPATPPDKQPLTEVLRLLAYGSLTKKEYPLLQGEDRLFKLLDDALDEALQGLSSGQVLDNHG